MSVSIAVNCPARTAVITWHVYADQSWQPAVLTRLVQEVTRFWNPTPPLKYKQCTVRLRVDLKQAPTPPQRPAGYDLLKMDWLTAAAVLDSPVGMGATLLPGGGAHAPDRYHQMTIFFPDPIEDFDWNIPGHEVGHSLGLSDPTPGQNWDESGLTDQHLRRIVDLNSSHSDAEGWTGWRKELACCGAVGDARTERDPGD